MYFYLLALHETTSKTLRPKQTLLGTYNCSNGLDAGKISYVEPYGWLLDLTSIYCSGDVEKWYNSKAQLATSAALCHIEALFFILNVSKPVGHLAQMLYASTHDMIYCSNGDHKSDSYTPESPDDPALISHQSCLRLWMLDQVFLVCLHQKVEIALLGSQINMPALRIAKLWG